MGEDGSLSVSFGICVSNKIGCVLMSDDDQALKKADEVADEIWCGHSEDLEAITEVGKELAESSTLVKAFTTIRDAIGLSTTANLREFIRTFSWRRIHEYDDEDLEDVERALSEPGEEILADYVRKVLDTFSPTARAALALLYADEVAGRWSYSFHRTATRALRGLTEQEVTLFLALWEIRRSDDASMDEKNHGEDPGYPVYSFRETVAEELGAWEEHASDFAFMMSFVDDFQTRGILLPDPSNSRFSGGPPSVIFGWGEAAEHFHELLEDARRIRSRVKGD